MVWRPAPSDRRRVCLRELAGGAGLHEVGPLAEPGRGGNGDQRYRALRDGSPNESEAA